MSTLIEATHLSRILPGDPPVTLVADVSLRVESGAFTTIVGPSGCGKSSLLYLLGLIDRPTDGTILFEGQDVTPLDGDERAALRLRRLGFVFQFHFLLPEFTAFENVILPMRRLGKLSSTEAEARALQLLDTVGLKAKAHTTPDHMSGGERQRVALARALANAPVLILGDEPTGTQDRGTSTAVVETLRTLAHEQQRAVVCVTHDPSVAEAADVRISMLDGRIVDVDG